MNVIKTVTTAAPRLERAAERAIAARMISEFDLDLSALALDMTNFATFIDSQNPHAPIAKRGPGSRRWLGMGWTPLPCH